MKRIAKRRLSCLLSAILLLVMSLDMSAFAGVFEKTARKIDVWDFGGVAESNTEMYQNNISASDWDNCSDVGTNAKFNAASIKFGDLTLITTSGDSILLHQRIMVQVVMQLQSMQMVMLQMVCFIQMVPEENQEDALQLIM